VKLKMTNCAKLRPGGKPRRAAFSGWCPARRRPKGRSQGHLVGARRDQRQGGPYGRRYGRCDFIVLYNEPPCHCRRISARKDQEQWRSANRANELASPPMLKSMSASERRECDIHKAFSRSFSIDTVSARRVADRGRRNNAPRKLRAGPHPNSGIRPVRYEARGPIAPP
jgi:hypothetical protein